MKQHGFEKRITRTGIELVFTRCASVFGILLYLLALPDVLTQIPIRSAGWEAAFLVGIPVAIICSLLIRRPGRWQQLSTGTAAVLLMGSFFLWHIGLIGGGTVAESKPWSYGIPGLGIGLAAIAFRTSFAATYAGLFCLLILLVPLTDAGNSREWYESGQDALLSAVLGVAILAPVDALRRAATASDQAAENAIVEEAAVARAEAIRVEQSRLDALTHDTVMAALTVAAQAQSKEVLTAAAQAASNALRQLDELHTTETEQDSISPDELINRLNAATLGYKTTIEHTLAKTATKAVPLEAARALVQASAEAVRNSSIHAEGASRVRVQFGARDRPDCVTIEISDSGPGFDPARVGHQRLGLRVSIIRRMQDVAGEAKIDSHPGRGTHIKLIWTGKPA